MNKVDLNFVSSYVSKLSVEQIKKLPDEKIMFLRMERPFYKGKYGFMLSPKYFKSDKHFSDTLVALMKRLSNVSTK